MRLLIIIIISFSCLIDCSTYTTQNNNGGASETVNAFVNICDSMVTVNLRAEDTVDAMVNLLGVDYNPVTNSGVQKSVAIRAKDSSVIFTNLNGIYNLIITDNIRGKSLSMMNIEISKGMNNIISDTLSTNGSVHGYVLSTQIRDSEDVLYGILIIGTPFFTKLDKNGEFELKGVPKGFYSIIAMMMTNQKSEVNAMRMVKREIYINSGESSEGINLYFSN